MLHIEFLAKAPFKTWTLEVNYSDEADAPLAAALKKDLAGIQWLPLFESKTDRFTGAEFIRKGEGLFGGWATGEGTEFLNDARRVLKNHGFLRVPKRKLSLADQL